MSYCFNNDISNNDITDINNDNSDNNAAIVYNNNTKIIYNNSTTAITTTRFLESAQSNIIKQLRLIVFLIM